MPFRIRFTGVCLFDLEDRAACRVLLPAARERVVHSEGSVPPHYGFLMAPADSVDVTKTDGTFKDRSQNPQEWAFVRLGIQGPTQIRVEGTGQASETEVAALIDPVSGLPNLRTLTDDTSQGPEENASAASVSLSGGYFVAHHTDGGLKGGRWHLNGSVRETMIHEATWVADAPIPRIELSPSRSLRLENRDVEIRVCCIEEADPSKVFSFERTRPLQRTCPDHDFRLLYGLLGQQRLERPIPIWKRDAAPRAAVGVPRGASLPTCFPAGWW